MEKAPGELPHQVFSEISFSDVHRKAYGLQVRCGHLQDETSAMMLSSAGLLTLQEPASDLQDLAKLCLLSSHLVTPRTN